MLIGKWMCYKMLAINVQVSTSLESPYNINKALNLMNHSITLAKFCTPNMSYNWKKASMTILSHFNNWTILIRASWTSDNLSLLLQSTCPHVCIITDLYGDVSSLRELSCGTKHHMPPAQTKKILKRHPSLFGEFNNCNVWHRSHWSPMLV